MSKLRSRQDDKHARIVKKVSISVFVVSSFLFYTFQQQFKPIERAKTVSPPVDTSVLQRLLQPAKPIYHDGTYIGNVVRAGYGRVQILVVIQGGKVSDVQFLDYPHALQTSQKINTRAMPVLQQEAIQAQTAQVDAVSGATITSQAFITSLQSALDLAKN